MNGTVIHIPGTGGYYVPCRIAAAGDEKKAVLITHGFGSAKEGTTAQALLEFLPRHGVAALALDLPGHGESPCGILRLAACLDDIAAAETYLRQRLPEAELTYFSSSFGAYLNLLYLSSRPHTGVRSFLRCPAVDMPEQFLSWITPEQRRQMEREGRFYMNEDDPRPVAIVQGFCDDLAGHDVFRLFRPDGTKLAMLHGDRDETIPLADVQRFAAQFSIPLTVAPGQDHRFQGPGGMELVLSSFLAFLDE